MRRWRARKACHGAWWLCCQYVDQPTCNSDREAHWVGRLHRAYSTLRVGTTVVPTYLRTMRSFIESGDPKRRVHAPSCSTARVTSVGHRLVLPKDCVRRWQSQRHTDQGDTMSNPEACRFCWHAVTDHNNMEGCTSCRCMGTQAEARPTNDKEGERKPISPSVSSPDYRPHPSPERPEGSERFTVSLTVARAREVMAAIEATCGDIVPVAPTQEQASLLYDFGCQIGSAMLYGAKR